MIFRQFIIMEAHLQAGAFEAPSHLITAAKSLMPKTVRFVVARLVASNLGLAGVRASEAHEVQALFEAEDHQVRVHYRSVSGGWEILGQGPPELESGVHLRKPFAIDGRGRFELRVRRLEDSGFTLQFGGLEMSVPPLSVGDDR